ncbi:hypothetical protein [Streptomyces sp. Root1310]|uniref:hypothetical protein n=1 Tax=Streptomyces sp. Root1310 TaxID=1736452 RepID=UPI00099EB503|nr:hypothetical protein [Streptomyces sp. Root1310]
MSRQGSRDTAPEVTVRRLLHGSGLSYRVNVPVPGMPRRTNNIVFSTARIAIFLHDCFSYGRPNTQRTRVTTDVREAQRP